MSFWCLIPKPVVYCVSPSEDETSGGWALGWAGCGDVWFWDVCLCHPDKVITMLFPKCIVPLLATVFDWADTLWTAQDDSAPLDGRSWTIFEVLENQEACTCVKWNVHLPGPSCGCTEDLIPLRPCVSWTAAHMGWSLPKPVMGSYDLDQFGKWDKFSKNLQNRLPFHQEIARIPTIL